MSTPRQKAEAADARKRAATMTKEQAAESLEKTAIVCWLPNDSQQLRTMALDVRAGRLAAALDYASNYLDTACREEIDPAVWVFIGGDLLHG